MRTGRWPAAAAILIAACGGSKASPPAGGTFTLSGTVSYDSVPAGPGGIGLDYLHIVEKPVRGAVVEVVGGNPQATLGSGTTGPAGQYSITWTGTPAVSLRVKAQTLSPPLRVQDNANAGALYALGSGPVDAGATPSVSLRARSGWTGSSYGAPRAAAPFAILDAMLSAAQAFLAVAPSAAFPELRANWSTQSASGTYYDPQAKELTILGLADADTDEYDSHVIIHEWGHYYEDRLSRSDSPGGSHTLGQQKDPRLAFSEGWGNALGAMVLYPDDLYADSNGPGQASGFSFALEPNAADDPAPGWYSEMSVAHFLYDLFDPVSAGDGDAIDLGLGPIHAAMAGPERTTPAFTTLFSFVDALKGSQTATVAANIDAMLSGRLVSSAIADPWGTGETRDAPGSGNLPVYRNLVVNGAAASVTLNAGFASNDLQAVRFLRFPGTGGTVTVRAGSSLVDVSLQVWHVGQRLAYADAHGLGEEVASVATASGDDYLVIVTGLQSGSGTYSVPVSVTSP